MNDDIVFEEWLWKLSGKHGQSRGPRLSRLWKKKFCRLSYINNRPFLSYYKSNPKTENEEPSERYPLTPVCNITKQWNISGKPFVLTLATSRKSLTFATENEKLFHLFSFFFQTFTRLKEHYEGECCVVRPDNVSTLQCIGAKGNMCLLHISKGGVTLALQHAKCVLGQWPLSSIRNYESSGTGQFTLDAGKNAPLGEGEYRFLTRAGYDDIIFDELDRYVMEATNERQNRKSQCDIAFSNELNHLRSMTYISEDKNVLSHLHRISRDIYDKLWMHLSARKPKDTTNGNEDFKISRSASVPVLDFMDTSFSRNSPISSQSSSNTNNRNESTSSTISDSMGGGGSSVPPLLRQFGYLHPSNNSPPHGLGGVGGEFNQHHQRQWSAPHHDPMLPSPGSNSDVFIQQQRTSDPPLVRHNIHQWSPGTTTGPSAGFFTNPRRQSKHVTRRENFKSTQLPKDGFLTTPRSGNSNSHGGNVMRHNPNPDARQRDRLKSRSFDDLNAYLQMSPWRNPNTGVTNQVFEGDDEYNVINDSAPSTPGVYTYTMHDITPVGLDARRNAMATQNRSAAQLPNGAPTIQQSTVQYSTAVQDNDLRKTKSNPSLVIAPNGSPTKSVGSGIRDFQPLHLHTNASHMPPDVAKRISIDSTTSQATSIGGTPVGMIQQGVSVTSETRSYRKTPKSSQSTQDASGSSAVTPGSNNSVSRSPVSPFPSAPHAVAASALRKLSLPSDTTGSIVHQDKPNTDGNVATSDHNNPISHSIKRSHVHKQGTENRDPTNRQAHRLPSLPNEQHASMNLATSVPAGTYC